MNAALATFDQLREERPEFGADYEKWFQSKQDLVLYWGNGTNGGCFG